MTEAEAGNGDLPHRLLRRALLEGEAYQAVPRTARDKAGLTRLDAMENPYPLPDALVGELGRVLARVPLHRYPDPGATELREVLQAHLHLPPGRGLLLGNGSDELIQLLFLAVAGGRSPCTLGPAPSFIMYRRLAPLLGMDHVEIPLRAEDFSLDEAALCEALRKHTPALLWLARPNNPTGSHYPVAQLRRLLDAAPGLVVIDEAYQAFTDDDCLELLQEYDRLLILRTFSKQGLAGLRLGLLLGAESWLRELEKLRLPYNIGSLNQAAALFLLRHWAVLEDQARMMRLERERLKQGLQQTPGIRVWPSQANFLLFRCLEREATVIFQALRRRGLLLKLLHGSHPLLHGCLRISVGTREENDRLLQALHQSIQETGTPRRPPNQNSRNSRNSPSRTSPL